MSESQQIRQAQRTLNIRREQEKSIDLKAFGAVLRQAAAAPDPVRHHLDGLVSECVGGGLLYHEVICQVRRRFICKVLEVHGGNQVHAAKQLGMHRNTLSRNLKELCIRWQDFRNASHKSVPAIPPQPVHAKPKQHAAGERGAVSL